MRTYLIVDDNLAFAENLAEIIRESGGQAVVATFGEQALQFIREFRFDAMVTDMRMPAMAGAQLIHEVRRLDHDLPAIVVSAYTEECNLAEVMRQGVLAVLPKPVPIEKLLQLLSTAQRAAQ